ncbi:hypothetical protein HOP50_10g57660 [Chloropicon primus]|nr:hypothetical protein HOP50_10g57660 [Chloropicon primus]
MPQRQPIRRSSHLADLIQGSGLVGSFDRRPASAAAALGVKAGQGQGQNQRARSARGKTAKEAGRGGSEGGIHLARWRDRPKSAPLARGSAGGTLSAEGVEAKAPSVLTERNRGEGRETSRPGSAKVSRDDKGKGSCRRPPPPRPSSAQAFTSSSGTVHEIPSRPNSSQGSREAWGRESPFGGGQGQDHEAEGSWDIRRVSMNDSRPSTSMSSALSERISSLSLGLKKKAVEEGEVEGGGEKAERDKPPVGPKRRYEKLRLLSKIMKRLEGEIVQVEAQFEKKVDELGRQQAEVVHKIEMGHKGGMAAVKTSIGKLELKCRELESDVKQNNKKWIEEIKVIKYGHQRELEAREKELEGERNHLQRTLIKQKEAKDLWLKTDLENGEQLKVAMRKLEKAEKKQSFLTKELDETMDNLQEANHKLLSQEMDVNVMRVELESAKEKLAEAEEALRSRPDEDGREENLFHSPTTARSPSPVHEAQEAFAVHLYGGEEMKKKMDQTKRHAASLERELRRTRDQLKSIRSEEMARHSVVLSELEERLQHSEKMGLKARIGASHVVKRIKDLLEKYYKPADPSEISGKPGKVTRRHMDQIQQELLMIFEKLEDLDQPALSLDGEGVSPASASEEDIGSPESSKNVGDRLSERTTATGAAMTEREALIFECTEYSIQNSTETENLSQVAQLEMQLLDAKVEADNAVKDAFENMNKAQGLERELNVTKARLKEAEKVLSRKKADWVGITKYADMTKRAEKAETLARGLKDEVQRQRTALKFMKQEKDSKEEELRFANITEFDLHQTCKKLQDDLKASKLEMKHLRSYSDILKREKAEEIDRLKCQGEVASQDLQAQLRKAVKRAENFQASEANLESRVVEYEARLEVCLEKELELKDRLHIADGKIEALGQEKTKVEEKLEECLKHLTVAEANVKYFRERDASAAGLDVSQLAAAAAAPTSRVSKADLTLESAFDIFVGGEQ